MMRLIYYPNKKKQVQIWVSDMCFFDPQQQINHLLYAHEKNILSTNAFFVLTLKFNTGHGKDTFDLFAQQEYQRLQQILSVTNVHTYHLFSNRKGERTLIGKLAETHTTYTDIGNKVCTLSVEHVSSNTQDLSITSL